MEAALTEKVMKHLVKKRATARVLAWSSQPAYVRCNRPSSQLTVRGLYDQPVKYVAYSFLLAYRGRT